MEKDKKFYLVGLRGCELDGYICSGVRHLTNDWIILECSFCMYSEILNRTWLQEVKISPKEIERHNQANRMVRKLLGRE